MQALPSFRHLQTHASLCSSSDVALPAISSACSGMHDTSFMQQPVHADSCGAALQALNVFKALMRKTSAVVAAACALSASTLCETLRLYKSDWLAWHCRR